MNAVDITLKTPISKVISYANDQGNKEGIESTLNACYAFFKLKQICAYRGENYCDIIYKHFRMSKTKGSKLVKIGSKFLIFQPVMNKLPSKYNTLYEIACFRQKVFEFLIEHQVINPLLTYNQVLKLKEEFNNNNYKERAKAKMTLKRALNILNIKDNILVLADKAAELQTIPYQEIREAQDFILDYLR